MTWLCFAWFVVCARILWARKDPDDPSRVDWSTTFGTWLETLDFGFVDRQTADRFERDVVRPLMYQFGLVAPDRLDDLSVRFVVFYFLGLMPRFPRAGFTILDSTIGLDGLMDRIRRNPAPSTTVECGVCVESVEHDGGGWIIRTRDDGATRRAARPGGGCTRFSGSALPVHAKRRNRGEETRHP